MTGRVRGQDTVPRAGTLALPLLTRFAKGGGSYLSSHDPRVVLGVGAAEKLDWLEVKWAAPSNRVERFTNLPIDRYITITEGKGIT